MERRIARNFYNRSKQLLPNDGERERLFSTLKLYQQTSDIQLMIENLKQVVNEPAKMQLYDDIRPLIPLKHQLEYDRLTPAVPSHRLRVIRLKRKPTENLGFSVRGGLEHGVGIYVSQVTTDSQAYQQGLRVGDQIVRVNGFTIDQAIHEEVLNLIKTRPEIVLKVRNVGMLPTRDTPGEPVTWKYVDRSQTGKAVKTGVSIIGSHNKLVKIYVNLTSAPGLGCSICSGPASFPGIFIQSIKPGGLAEEAGLVVGDMIVDVNGTLFQHISHSEALLALKGTKELFITLKKGAGAPLFGKAFDEYRSQKMDEDDKMLLLRKMTSERHSGQQKKGDSKSFDMIRTILEEEEFQKDEEQKKVQEQLRLMLMQEREIIESQLKRQAMRELELNKHLEEQERRERDEARLRHNRELQSQQHNELDDRRTQQERLNEEIINKARERELRKKFDHLSQASTTPEEKVKIKMKRLEKEKTHNQHITDHYKWRFKREEQIRKLRYLQDQEEISREEIRTGIPVRSNSFNVGALSKAAVSKPPAMRKPITSSRIHSPETDSIDRSFNSDNFDPSEMFNPLQLSNRQVQVIKIKKDGPLEIDLEGGLGTPLAGRIIVADVYAGGSVQRQGGIHQGDQLMMVDGEKLVDVTLNDAWSLINNAMALPGTLKLVVAKASPKEYEDNITYF